MVKRSWVIVGSIILLLAIIVGVSYSLTRPSPAITTPSPTPPAITTPSPTPTTPAPILKEIEEAAKREGKLVIYSTLDEPSARPLLDAFKAKYPFIDVVYVTLGSLEIYNRYVTERAAGTPTADILWSSAVDLQYILVREGSAQPYRVSIYDFIPDEAKYKELAYISSFIVTGPAYNTHKFPKGSFPTSYQGLLKMLTDNKSMFPPRSIAVYDIEKSAFGLVFTYYYYKANPDLFANIFKAAGSIGVLLHTAAGPQLEGIKVGELYMSLGLVTNYAYREAETDPRIDAILPQDYVVLVPRYMFITKEAPHPNAAKLFIEFVLSREGQLKLAEAAEATVVIDNSVFPQLSLKYIKDHVKQVFVVKMGDPYLDELLDSNVRREFIAMYKSWLGVG